MIFVVCGSQGIGKEGVMPFFSLEINLPDYQGDFELVKAQWYEQAMTLVNSLTLVNVDGCPHLHSEAPE